MKKILLMLAVMLPCLGAWAQELETETLTIENFNASNTTWTKYNGTTLTTGWGYKVVVNTTPAITLQRVGNTNDLGWSTVNSVRYAYLVRGKEYSITIPENYEISTFEITTENSGRTEGEVNCVLQENKREIRVTVSEHGTNTQGVLIKRITLNLKKQVCTYNLTDEIGNTYTGTYQAVKGITPFPTFTGLTYELTDGVWEGNTYTANIEITYPCDIPVSSETKVNPTMISSFKGDSHQPNGSFLWYVSGDNVKILKNVDGTAATNATIQSYMWAIYPKLTDEKFTLVVKNLLANKFLASDKAYASDKGNHTSDDVNLVDEVSATGFSINGNGQLYYEGTNGLNQYLSWGSVNSSEGYLGVYAKSHAGTYNSFHSPAFKLTVGEFGYASLYTPFAGTFAGEVKTYAIESASNNSALLSEKIGVAANQGAIVMAEEGTYTFTAGEVASDWTGNKLTGTSVNTYVAGDAYVLGNREGIGLYKALLNKNENGDAGNSHFLNNAGKAYLPATAVSSNAQALRFTFGGTTAIESVINNDANAPIYDLSGRRIMNAVKGGIYIQNGKKFIVK